MLRLLPRRQAACARARRGGGILLPGHRGTSSHAAGRRWRRGLLLPWWKRSRRGRWLVAGRRRWRWHHAHWWRKKTHGVSVRSGTMAHWGRRGLHPWGRHAIRVGRHRRSPHVGHRGREAMRSSWPCRHAVEVPVLSRSRAHPWRPIRRRLVVVGS